MAFNFFLRTVASLCNLNEIEKIKQNSLMSKKNDERLMLTDNRNYLTHVLLNYKCKRSGLTIVNSEIFATVQFLRNFACNAKFRENKIFAKCRNHSVLY